MTMSDGFWMLMAAVCVGTLAFLAIGIVRGIRVLDPKEHALETARMQDAPWVETEPPRRATPMSTPSAPLL